MRVAFARAGQALADAAAGACALGALPVCNSDNDKTKPNQPTLPVPDVDPAPDPQKITQCQATTSSNECDDDQPVVLYHYTRATDLAGIHNSQKLWPARDGFSRYGSGAYLTDIDPETAAEGNKRDMSIALFSTPNVQHKVVAYLGIDVSGLGAQRVASIYPQGSYPTTYGIWLVPGGSISLKGRVVRAGMVDF
jgi:hypothetical protein